MDTSFLNFHGIEHFSLDSYFSDHSGIESHNFDDVSNHSTHTFAWEWESEREINGDVALIPSTITSTECSTSSQSKEDINKMLSEWQQLINVEASAEDMTVCMTEFPILEDKNEFDDKRFIDEIDNIYENNFDITTYINQSEPEPPEIQIKSIGPGGKKIDMEAQKYVIDDDSEDDHIDVETISEDSSPVLEARDVNSLLEQFEAETRYNKTAENDSIKKITFETNNINCKLFDETKCELGESSSNLNKCSSVNKLENDRHKQIKEALPQELITRIKQCSKRKPISVIPAKPTRKRGRQCNVENDVNKQKLSKSEASHNNHVKTEKKSQVITTSEFLKSQNHVKSIKVETEQTILQTRKSISIDHDYCVQSCPYPKQPMKDSGFESAEEDDKYSIKCQPTIKSSNGKTMVSILKSNNIRNTCNSNNQIVKQKKKLNLEEYKKRRDFNIKNSASNSPSSSGRESPVIIEDENTRRIKHQELLTRMASEVLKAKIKEEDKSSATIKTDITLIDLPDIKPKLEIIEEEGEIISPDIKPIPNFEMKTIVSMGTNTEESWSDLQEIKPILENINVIKIKPNSLIASVIENIPKIKTKQKIVDNLNSTNGEEHGEDKTIVYLDKNRPAVVTCNTYVQTDDFKCNINEYRSRREERRRNSSSSDSRSSSTSSSSYHSSRSRSPSPYKTKHKRRLSQDYEKIREVEERRVVYVGGISDTTTREDLKLRFQTFGPISNVSVHFRSYSDNYGFVTFLHKLDAYEAVEHGNDDPLLPRYDLSFGGRRMFCKTTYADLDNVRDESNYFSPKRKEDSFDNLLREAQAKMRRRKF